MINSIIIDPVIVGGNDINIAARRIFSLQPHIKMVIY